MIPRGKLDISWSALGTGLRYCLQDLLSTSKPSPAPIDEQNTIHCLSVRTGLDLCLRALKLEPGSEILVSNINIPDMFSIIAAHQLIAVPLPIDKQTLDLSLSDVSAAINTKTKAILITHLFGAIMDADSVIRFAKKHNLIVLEDCAQAFDGIYKGHPLSDVALFSFGLIKTNTSVTGARLHTNNPEFRGILLTLNSALPTQKTSLYFKKLLKAGLIKILTTKFCYTLLYRWSQINGKDFDAILSGFSKGFPGAEVMHKIQYRPCTANLRLMQKRAYEFSMADLERRKLNAKCVMRQIPVKMHIGALNPLHSHWVLPVESSNPESLIIRLRKNGIDATAKASSLIKLPSIVKENDLTLGNLVYVPIQISKFPIE